MNYLKLLIFFLSISSFGSTIFGVKVKRVYTTFEDQDSKKSVAFVYVGSRSSGGEKLGFVFDTGEFLDLHDTEFKIDVSLYDRKVVFEDKKSKLTFTMPTAPGGLDVHGKESVTPLLKNAVIFKNTAIEKRCKPSYFHCLPFIRVLTQKSVSKGWTGIGFHIKQNPRLKRTFDSHGCLRLSKENLISMDRILRYGIHKFLDVNFHRVYRPELRVSVRNNAPLVRNFYQKEKDFGNGETRRGKSGLVIFDKKYTSPPWDNLEEGLVGDFIDYLKLNIY